DSGRRPRLRERRAHEVVRARDARVELRTMRRDLAPRRREEVLQLPLHPEETILDPDLLREPRVRLGVAARAPARARDAAGELLEQELAAPRAREVERDLGGARAVVLLDAAEEDDVGELVEEIRDALDLDDERQQLAGSVARAALVAGLARPHAVVGAREDPNFGAARGQRARRRAQQRVAIGHGFGPAGELISARRSRRPTGSASR